MLLWFKYKMTEHFVYEMNQFIDFLYIYMYIQIRSCILWRIPAQDVIWPRVLQIYHPLILTTIYLLGVVAPLQTYSELKWPLCLYYTPEGDEGEISSRCKWSFSSYKIPATFCRFTLSLDNSSWNELFSSLTFCAIFSRF